MGWNYVCIKSVCSINNKSVYWTINKSVNENIENINYQFIFFNIIELVIVFQCLQDLLLCSYQLLVRIDFRTE
jgi:hypothetical protein